MAVKKRNVPARAKPPRVVAAPAEAPINKAVDTFFKNNDSVRAALSRNLKERAAVSLKAADKAKAAFAQFVPSKYSHAERTRRNFVLPEANSVRTTRAVVDKGVEAIRASAPSRAMKIHVEGGLKDIVDTKGGKGSVVGKLALADLMAYVAAKTSSTLTLNADPAFTECQAEMEAQRRLDQVMGNDDNVPAPGVDVPLAEAGDAAALTADALVNQQVGTQMATATSPESRVAFNVPARSNVEQTGKSIETFELRAGPADVTSYHDFNNLQIAFEHVWTEIFDGRLKALGEELYHESASRRTAAASTRSMT
jgi:hypothetical protein